jgi:mycothiol synthase
MQVPQFSHGTLWIEKGSHTMPEEDTQNQMSEIVRIDQLHAPDEVMEELARHILLLMKERNPEYPLLPMEELIKNLRHPPEEAMEVGFWTICDGKRVVARSNGWVNLTESEIPTMMSNITVLPEYRRKGLATRLLDPLKELARQHGKSTLILESTDRQPSGREFLTHIRAEEGLVGHVNRLDLRDLDRNLMQEWIRKADERVEGFSLLFFEGVPSDHLMDSYCQMYTHIMETQPSGLIQFPFKVFTPELVREMFKMDENAGRRFWTLVAIEEATGRIVGYTELFFHPQLPQLITQGGTCVFTEYRNRGIGRWLKASLVLKLVEEVPEAHWITTGNADVNASMLKINHEMGYKPCEATAFWQYHIP